MNRFVWSVLFTTSVAGASSACRSIGDAPNAAAPRGSAGPVTADASTPKAIAVADAAAPVAPEPAPIEPLKWGTRPTRARGELGYVIDGYCTLADVALLDGVTLVKYGEHGSATVARVSDDGALVETDKFGKNIPEAFKYGTPVGVYPDAIFWELDMGGRAFSRPFVTRWSPDSGWQPFKDRDAPPVAVLGKYGRGVLTLKQRCPEGMADCVPAGIAALGETSPNLASDAFAPSAFYAWPDKSVVAVGNVCPEGKYTGCATEARHFSPDAGRKVFRLGTDLGAGTVVGRTRDHVTAAFGHGAVLRFDGSRWNADPAYAKPKGAAALTLLAIAPDGAQWALTDKSRLLRKRDDQPTWEDVTPPAPPADQLYSYAPMLDGIASGTVWVIRSKKLFKSPSTGDVRWEEVTVPKPPLSSRQKAPELAAVRVKGPDDVWVNATYTETYGAQTRYERRRALLRTGPIKETLRCRDREGLSGGMRGGFESWPPRADGSCTTPAVVVGRGALDASGFARTRALLKGKAGLKTVELIEVTAVGLPYIVARTATLDEAKKVADATLTKIWNVSAEVVCADPPGARVRVDIATGSVIEGDAKK